MRSTGENSNSLFSKLFIVNILFCFSCISLQSQDGVQFITGTPWQDILKLAREEKKLVFVDVYTEWCGPCKVMDREVFVVPAVGTLYNANFINVKIDAEKGEGVSIAKKYSVGSYPDYLFVNADGVLVGRHGGSMPAERFIELGNQILSDTSFTETIDIMDQRYPALKNDKDFMYRYLKLRTRLKLPVSTLLNDYFNMLTTAERSELNNLQLVVDNGVFTNRKLIFGSALEALRSNASLFPQLKKPDHTTLPQIISWTLETSLSQAIKTKDTLLLAEILQKASPKEKSYFDNQHSYALEYYYKTQQYDRYKAHAIDYIDNFLLKISPDTLDQRDLKVYRQQQKYIEENRASIIERSGEYYVSDEYVYSYRRTQTIQQLNNIHEHVTQFMKTPLTRQELRKIDQWTKFILKTTATDTVYYINVIPVYTITGCEVLHKRGKKKKAIARLQQLQKQYSEKEYIVKEIDKRINSLNTR